MIDQRTFRARVTRKLDKLGPYKLQKDPVRFGSPMHQLKYRIVNSETGATVLGKCFTATLDECEAFAEDPRNSYLYQALQAIESMPPPTTSVRCELPDTVTPSDSLFFARIADHPDYTREMQEARNDGILSERHRCAYIARWWARDGKDDERDIALGIAATIEEMEGYPSTYYNE